ncbi:MAG: hypothetical protein AAFY29_12350 [Pseudomonadota bacterium]
MKLNAFGRTLIIHRVNNAWEVLDQGNEGKRRLARDVVIPASLSEGELVGYVSDLLHEYASEKHPVVEIIE